MTKQLLLRPIAVTMCLIAVVVMGCLALRYIPISLMPDIDVPQITVQANMPGYSAIKIAQQQSYDAMVAKQSFMSQYWSYRSFQAELLPSVNLSGSLLQFDRSMVEARNYDDGRIAYVENNSMSNSLSLSIDQNIAVLGASCRRSRISTGWISSATIPKSTTLSPFACAIPSRCGPITV